MLYTDFPSRQVLAFINKNVSRPMSFTLHSFVAKQPQNWDGSKLLENRLSSIHLKFWLKVYESHITVKNKVLLNHCH